MWARQLGPDVEHVCAYPIATRPTTCAGLCTVAVDLITCASGSRRPASAQVLHHCGVASSGQASPVDRIWATELGAHDGRAPEQAAPKVFTVIRCPYEH